RHIAATRDSDVAGSDLQFICVDIGRLYQTGKELCASNRKEQRRNIKTDHERDRESGRQRAERAELPLVDLIAEADVFRPVEGILCKKVNERDLFGLRLMDRINRADQAIFESGVLFFHKARELDVA